MSLIICWAALYAVFIEANVDSSPKSQAIRVGVGGSNSFMPFVFPSSSYLCYISIINWNISKYTLNVYKNILCVCVT